jgi:hypothetical protein
MLALSACDYDVPITTSPTRPVDARLFGDWWLLAVEKDQREPHLEHVKIRRFDDSNYSISYQGDLYRAYHSDVAGLPLVSAQNIEDKDRKYLYFAWQLSSDGKRLTLRRVSTEVIPKATTDAATIVKLIENSCNNPQLFHESVEYTRVP